VRQTTAVVLVSLSCLAGAVAAPRPKAVDPLSERVVIQTGIYALDTLMQRLSRSGVRKLAAQASIDDWDVLPASGGSTVRSLMDAVGAASCCEWRYVEDTHVLTDLPGAERLALRSESAAIRYGREFMRLRITPGQAALLEAGQCLDTRDLMPEQRTGIQRIAWYQYAANGMIGPEALLLEGFFLATSSGHPAVAPGEVGLFFSMPDGVSPRPRGGFSLKALPVGPIAETAGPRGPAIPSLPPSVTGTIPRHRSLREARLDEDSELDERVTLDASSKVFDALAAVADQTGQGVVVVTAFGARKLELPSKTPSARQVLQAVAKATGGTWKTLAGIYCPDS